MKIIIKPRFPLVGISVMFLFLSVSCRVPSMMPVRQVVLGTVCTVNLFEDGNQKIYDEIFTRLNNIEKKLSAKTDDSEIAAVNAQAGISPVIVSEETFSVIEAAVNLAHTTDGAFDPTIGPVVSLWDIGGGNERVPSSDEIEAALKLVNYRSVQLNRENKTVFLSIKGMKIDLGGIAKGYAADETAAILKTNGVQRALIDLGGNIYAYGAKKTGTPWTLGIRNPAEDNTSAVISLSAENTSLVTSGLYERYFTSGGIRYHHIIDPKTGYPADNDVLSFSILCSSSMTADALSTACFVLGSEKGLKILEKIDNASGIVICADKSVKSSAEMRGKLAILDTSFTLGGE